MLTQTIVNIADLFGSVATLLILYSILKQMPIYYSFKALYSKVSSDTVISHFLLQCVFEQIISISPLLILSILLEHWGQETQYISSDVSVIISSTKIAEANHKNNMICPGYVVA